MKNKTLKIAAMLMLAAASLASCDKEEITADCYDKDLYESRKNSVCTMDCPGVTGCDGKFYCNECVAESKGIRVKN